MQFISFHQYYALHNFFIYVPIVTSVHVWNILFFPFYFWCPFSVGTVCSHKLPHKDKGSGREEESGEGSRQNAELARVNVKTV